MPILHKEICKFQVITIEMPMRLRKLEKDVIITMETHWNLSSPNCYENIKTEDIILHGSLRHSKQNSIWLTKESRYAGQRKDRV